MNLQERVDDLLSRYSLMRRDRGSNHSDMQSWAAYMASFLRGQAWDVTYERSARPSTSYVLNKFPEIEQRRAYFPRPGESSQHEASLEVVESPTFYLPSENFGASFDDGSLVRDASFARYHVAVRWTEQTVPLGDVSSMNFVKKPTVVRIVTPGFEHVAAAPSQSLVTAPRRYDRMRHHKYVEHPAPGSSPDLPGFF